MTGIEFTDAVPIIKMLAPTAVKGVGKALGWGADKVRFQFAKSFSDHLELVKRKCSFVRTINQPDFPTKLDAIYVNLYASAGDRTFRDDDILDLMQRSGPILITGTAGAGKSMLMRYLALRAMTDVIDQIPLFIDLRDLPDPASVKLFDSIFERVTPEAERQNRDVFDQALKAGGFCLFLDGVDEVAPENRVNMKDAIEDICIRYPKLSIILSSRPDVDFTGWEQFYTLQLMLLNNEQTKLLIEKVPYGDPECKEIFLRRLSAGEFENRKSFLQVPLLSVLLLMFFGEHLHLGESSTSFYDQAFEVLYRRHDRTKGLRRTHFSKLSSDAFRKAFAAFCYKSLVDSKISFTEEELNSYVNKASIISGIELDSADFSQDIIESVSMMQRDGSKILFIHRSFQEYFAAIFIARYKGDEAYRVHDIIYSHSTTDNVAPMVFEIDQASFEREWALPTLRAITADLSQKTSYFDIVSSIVAQFNIANVDDEYRFSGWGWSPAFHESRLRVLSKVYQNRLDASSLFSTPVFASGDASIDVSKVIPKRFLPTESQPIYSLSLELDADKKIDLEWLEYTTAAQNIASLIEGLSLLVKDVEQRVSRRLSVSIFD